MSKQMFQCREGHTLPEGQQTCTDKSCRHWLHDDITGCVNLVRVEVEPQLGPQIITKEMAEEEFTKRIKDYYQGEIEYKKRQEPSQVQYEAMEDAKTGEYVQVQRRQTSRDFSTIEQEKQCSECGHDAHPYRCFHSNPVTNLFDCPCSFETAQPTPTLREQMENIIEEGDKYLHLHDLLSALESAVKAEWNKRLEEIAKKVQTSGLFALNDVQEIRGAISEFILQQREQ